MSAERLREAAALMRESWEAPAAEAAEARAEGIAVGTMAPTMLAVANLLNAQAAIIGEHGGFFDIEGMGDANALAVADAYLGADSSPP